MDILLEAMKELFEEVDDISTIKPLDKDALYAEIEATTPGAYVHAGYINDVTSKYVSTKFTGGRGSEGNPRIQLIKLTEVYGRCGIDHESIQAIKDKRAAGIERQGNKYEIESELGNKIFHIPGTNNSVLQIYPRSKSDVKVKYFMSVDGGPFEPAAREDFAEYCKPAVLKPGTKDFDPSSPMRWNLTKIYWFRNLGQSALK